MNLGLLNIKAIARSHLTVIRIHEKCNLLQKQDCRCRTMYKGQDF